MWSQSGSLGVSSCSLAMGSHSHLAGLRNRFADAHKRLIQVEPAVESLEQLLDGLLIFREARVPENRWSCRASGTDANGLLFSERCAAAVSQQQHGRRHVRPQMQSIGLVGQIMGCAVLFSTRVLPMSSPQR